MDHPATPTEPATPAQRIGWWAALSGAAGAAAVSAYLLWLTTRPDAHLRGCGGGGCREAWASKWSTLFGLPVAAGALVVYLAVLALLCMPLLYGNTRRLAMSRGLTALAAVVLLSVVYFAAIQGLVVSSWCKWCLASHALGLVAVAGILLQRPWRHTGTSGAKGAVLSALAGATAVAVFAVLQAIDPGPQTHKIVELDPAPAGDTDAPEAVPGRPAEPPATLQDDPDTLRLPDGTTAPRGDFPTIGPAEADIVVFKLYDYTCDACRDMHNDLEEVWPGLEGRAALVLIPCPMHRGCHPDLPAGIRNHAGACELAKIGLAVWRVDPTQFPAYHRWAFENRPRIANAEQYAAELVGADALAAALADPALDEAIAAAARLFASAGGPRMPKLFLPDGKLVVGVTRDTRQTREALERSIQAVSPGG